MQTLGAISILIAERVNKQFDPAFLLQCADRIKYWRSRFMRDTLNKNPQERKFFLQTIRMPMEPNRSFNECGTEVCGVPNISRTKYQIPQPVRANGVLFDYFGSIDGKNPFTYATSAISSYKTDDRFASMFQNYDYVDGFGEVFNNPQLPEVMIRGIFDDPIAAWKLQCTVDKSPCNLEDMAFPISGDILQLCIQSIYQVDFGLMPQQESKVEIKTDRKQVVLP